MVRDPRAYLWDVQQAAEAIRQFTQGLDQAGYTNLRSDRCSLHVMAGLVPAINAFDLIHYSRRGCPRQARA